MNTNQQKIENIIIYHKKLIFDVIALQIINNFAIYNDVKYGGSSIILIYNNFLIRLILIEHDKNNIMIKRRLPRAAAKMPARPSASSSAVNQANISAVAHSFRSQV